MNRITHIVFFICLSVFVTPSMAQDSAKKTPIEVTADNALEWNRNAMTFTATGNAVLSQGNDKITADTLIAHYTDKNGATEITSVTATSNVRMHQDDTVLTAKTAIADFQKGQLYTVTAKDSVIIKTQKETLRGDNAVYNTYDNMVIVTGHVTIENGDNIIKGDKGVYDLTKNISRLTADPKSSQSNGRVTATFYSE